MRVTIDIDGPEDLVDFVLDRLPDYLNELMKGFPEVTLKAVPEVGEPININNVDSPW